MDEQTPSSNNNTAQLILYWAVVGVPLAWGIYKTILKLPALFH